MPQFNISMYLNEKDYKLYCQKKAAINKKARMIINEQVELLK